jgi:hypothetical protein
LRWVLFAPFLLLSLLSPAVMPARSADGTLTLVLCSDGDATEVVIDLATGEPVEQAPSGRSDRCDWACGQMALAELMPPAAPAPPTLVRRAEPPPAAVVIALARVTGLPPATGPPARV